VPVLHRKKKFTNKFKGLMQQVSVQAVTKNANWGKAGWSWSWCCSRDSPKENFGL